MLTQLLAVLGLALACGGWVLVQRFVARHDPEAPTIESRCGGGCGGHHGRQPGR